MQWLTWWRGTARTEEPAPAVAAPVRPDDTMRGRFERWVQWWQAQRGPSLDELERAEAERIRQAGEQFTDQVLKACARNGGVFFPGDGDEPRTPARETWEGEGGVRWFRL